MDTNCYKFRRRRHSSRFAPPYHSRRVKPLAAFLLALAVLAPGPALAQPGPGRPHGQPWRHMQREMHRPMPAPERRMGWEERQRLREQVHNGQMTRDEARQQWREERARRALEPGRSAEERERLRRDIMEANRDLERR